jgi:hypothetical protein
MATDWTSIKLEYVNGHMSQRDLADKHQINPAGLMKRAANEGWEAERQQKSAEVSKVAQDLMTEDRTAVLAKFNEDDLRMARAIRAKAATMMKSIESPSELRAIASAADVAQKIGRLALGAETENTIVTSRELPASVDEFV